MSLDVRDLDLPGVRLITPRRHGDHRGSFTEIYNRARLADAGISLEVVQENQSVSAEPGTIRGLHFQVAPQAQAKLVRVASGRIWDVVVDIRPDSPTFGDWTAAELTAEGGEQIWVPRGFAHGLCTLEPHTTVVYLVDAPYAPDCERIIRWDDPALDLPWPVAATDAILSERDRAADTCAVVTGRSA